MNASLLALLKRQQPEAPPAAETAAVPFGARSAAVEALERAVAAGDAQAAGNDGARPKVGQALPADVHDYSVDVDGLECEQLSVTPITLIASEYVHSHYRQIAANEDFICYGLKQGHVRVLCRTSPVRSLLKGHKLPVSDLQFLPGTGSTGASLLASGGQDGRLCVWRLSLEERAAALREEAVLSVSFAPQSVLLSWQSEQLLAAGVGSRVLLLDLRSSGLQSQADLDAASELPAGMTCLSEKEGETMVSLAFSPDGTLLVARWTDGSVGVWRVEKEHAGSSAASTTIQPQTRTGTGSVQWLPSEAGCLLLVGSSNNSVLELWHAESLSEGFSLLQTVRLGQHSGKDEPYFHVAAAAAERLLVIVDTPGKAVLTLHFSGSGRQARFDYVARFGVAVPILSLSVLCSQGADPPAVELSCVQTTAVQQYTLDPAACYDAHAALPAAPQTADVQAPQAAPLEALPSPPPRAATEQVEAVGTEDGSTERAAPPALPSASPGSASRASSAAAGQAAAEPAVEPSVGPAAPATAAAAAATGASPQDASEGASSEGCPSPPPTPHDVAAALELSSTQPLNHTHALLTPEDVVASAVGTSAAIAAAAAAAAGSPGREETPTSPDPASVPPPGSPVSLAARAAAANGLPGAAAISSAELSQAVAAAVAEQLQGTHKKFAGHVSLMYRELLKALKAELNQQQHALHTSLAAALAAQKQQAEAERAALAAEERANMQRLLAAVSSSLNQDLPQRLQEAFRAEVSGLGASLAPGVAAAVQQALKATLTKEVSGAVATGLDQQLTRAVQGSLSGALQDAFRTSFSQQLLPAVERSTQAMFQQINSALSAGLQEHTQAWQATTSGPQQQLTQQLQDALATVQQLATALSAAQSEPGSARASSSGTVLSFHATRESVQQRLRAGQYEEAFTEALSMQDVQAVHWLCAQVEPAAVLSKDGLSQPVLLSLLAQVAADLSGPAWGTKFNWIREAALALDPGAPLVAQHVRPVLNQVLSSLQAAKKDVPAGEASSLKLCVHVIRSQLALCPAQ